MHAAFRKARLASQLPRKTHTGLPKHHRARINLCCAAVSSGSSAAKREHVVKLPITSSQLLGLSAKEVSPEAVVGQYQSICDLPVEEGYSAALVERRHQILDAFADSLLAGWDSGAADALVEVHTSAVPAVLSVMNEVGMYEQVLMQGKQLMLNWDVRLAHKRDILLAMALAHCGLAAPCLAAATATQVLEGCSHLEVALQLLREGGKPSLAPGLVADAEGALLRFQRQHLMAIFQQQVTPELKKRRQQAVSELRTLLPAHSTPSTAPPSTMHLRAASAQPTEVAPDAATPSSSSPPAQPLGQGHPSQADAGYAFEAMQAMVPAEIVALHRWPDLAAATTPRPPWLSPDVARMAALAHMEAGLRQRQAHFFITAMSLLEALVPDRREVLAELAVCNLLVARPRVACNLLLLAESLMTKGQPDEGAGGPSAGLSGVLDAAHAAVFARRIGGADANKGWWGDAGRLVSSSSATSSSSSSSRESSSRESISSSTESSSGESSNREDSNQGAQAGSGGVSGDTEQGAAEGEQVEEELPLLGILTWSQLWLGEVALPSLRAPPAGHVPADLADYYFLLHPSTIHKLPGSPPPSDTTATLQRLRHCSELLPPPLNAQPRPSLDSSPDARGPSTSGSPPASIPDPSGSPYVSLTAAVASGVRIVDVEATGAVDVPALSGPGRPVLPLAALERLAAEKKAAGARGGGGVQGLGALAAQVKGAVGGVVEGVVGGVRGGYKRMSPAAKKDVAAAGLAAACSVGVLVGWLVGTEAGRRALHRAAPGASIATMIAHDHIMKRLPGSYQEPPEEALTVRRWPGATLEGSLDKATAELIVWHWQAARAAALGPQHDTGPLQQALAEPMLTQQLTSATSFKESGRFLRINLEECQVVGVTALPTTRAPSEAEPPAAARPAGQQTPATASKGAAASSSSSSGKQRLGETTASSTSSTPGTRAPDSKSQPATSNAAPSSGSSGSSGVPVPQAPRSFRVAVCIEEKVTLFSRDGSVAAAPASSYVEELTVLELPADGSGDADRVGIGLTRWRVSASKRVIR